ncbi:hypothetical protein C1H46_004220 [Malus baccata]|uniref:Uncharacterized protein n=1 Tax=Malus baccata TaxID=106549 RepID=A0A540NGK2_MALBA|nr:hypothetical protein C1H46_004220 [Malus baccata]
MFEPSRSSLESYEEEVLGDPYDHQTCLPSNEEAVKEGVLNDVPIFRSKFTADQLDKNLLDSRRQLDAIRESCCIPNNVGMHLVHNEELPTELPKGHVMVYTQILEKLGVKFPLHPWLQKMIGLMRYAPGQLNPGLWETLIGTYIIWMECGLGEPSFLQWRYCYKMHSAKSSTGNVECACRSEKERIVFVSKKAIKLSRQELADVKKVLRVPKEDRHLGKLRPLFQKYVEKMSKKGKTTMLVLVDNILFHKGARNHRVKPIPMLKSQEEVLKIATSKRAEIEAIRCVAAIVAGEDRRLLPFLPNIDPIFPPVMEHTG